MSQLFCRSHTSRLTILSDRNLINAPTPRASAVFLVFMTSNVIDRASIPMVPSLMLSAMVLHPLSPVPKTGSRSEPNREVLYSRLMMAQRINGNCLSRSTKIFLFFFGSTRLLVRCFLRHLTFPLRLYPFMRLYRVFPLVVAFSHCHLSLSSCYLSLSTRPPTLSCCRTKLQNAAPPPIGGIPQSSCCLFVDKALCVVEKEDGES